MPLPLNFESPTLREISGMIRNFVLYTDFILDCRLCFFEYLLNPPNSRNSSNSPGRLDSLSQIPQQSQMNSILTIDSQWNTAVQNLKSRHKWTPQYRTLAPPNIRDCLFLYMRESGQSSNYVGNFYMRNAVNISANMQRALSAITNTHVYSFLNDLSPSETRDEQENILKKKFNEILQQTGTVYFTPDLCTASSVGQDFNSNFFNSEQDLLHIRKKMNTDVIEYLNILCHPTWETELSKNYKAWFIYLTNLEQLLHLDKQPYENNDLKKWASAIRNQELLVHFNSQINVQHPLNHVLLFRRIKSHLLRQNILLDFFLLIGKKTVLAKASFKKTNESYWHENDSETIRKCYANPSQLQLSTILYFIRFQRNLLVPGLYVGNPLEGSPTQNNQDFSNYGMDTMNSNYGGMGGMGGPGGMGGMGGPGGMLNPILTPGIAGGKRLKRNKKSKKKCQTGGNLKTRGGLVNQHLGFTPIRQYLLSLCTLEEGNIKDIQFSVFGKDETDILNPLFFDTEFNLMHETYKAKEHEKIRASWCGNSFGCALYQFLVLYYKTDSVQFIRTTLYKDFRTGGYQESISPNLSFFFAIKNCSLYPVQEKPANAQPDVVFAVPCLRNSSPPKVTPLTIEGGLYQREQQQQLSEIPDEQLPSEQLEEEIQKKSLQVETLDWIYLAPFFRFYFPNETYNGYINDLYKTENVMHNTFSENTIYHLERCRDGKAYIYSPYNLGNKYPYDSRNQSFENQQPVEEFPEGVTSPEGIAGLEGLEGPEGPEVTPNITGEGISGLEGVEQENGTEDLESILNGIGNDAEDIEAV
jgi:hypothetical protein